MMRWCMLAALLMSCGGGTDAKPPTGSGGTAAPGDAGVVKAGDPFSDDARKLFHCAAASGDAELIVQANLKLGLGNANGTPTDKLAAFTQTQPAWTKKNAKFAEEYADAEKAAACVRERLQ